MKRVQSALSSNPIFVRLAGHNRSIPSAFTLVLLLAAQATVTTVMALPYTGSPIPGHRIVRMMVAGWFVVLVIPSIIAVTTSMVVARDASRSEVHQLPVLTDFTPSNRVNGYVAASLYRLRLLLMLLVVIMPRLVLSQSEIDG